MEHHEYAQPAPSDYTPSYRLFSSQAVFIAGFLGTMFASFLVMAINAFKLGQQTRGFMLLAVGGVLTPLYLMLALLIPDGLSFIFMLLNLGILFGLKALTEKLFASDFEQQIARGGDVGMVGPAIAIGIATFIPFCISV